VASLTAILVCTSFSDRPKRGSTVLGREIKVYTHTKRIHKTSNKTSNKSYTRATPPPPPSSSPSSSCGCILNSPQDHCTTPMENHGHDAVACCIACSLFVLSSGALGPSSPTNQTTQTSVCACCSNQLRLAPVPSFIVTRIPLPGRSRVGSSLI
jgi:hypothetical protein